MVEYDRHKNRLYADGFRGVRGCWIIQVSEWKHLIKYLSVWFIQRIPKLFPFRFFHCTRDTKWWNCSTHWRLYSPAPLADSISCKDYRMVIPSMPMFFFDTLYLEMTRVTIVAPKTNMRSPLVTVDTFFVLWIATVYIDILVHIVFDQQDSRK